MKLSKENRKKMMIKDLVLSNVPISIDAFSMKYKLKSRMIRYIIDDIKEDLSQFGVNLDYKTKTGYFIDQQTKHLIPKDMIEIENHVYTDQELSFALFMELVFTETEISAEYLAEKYYSSPSTIIRYFQKMMEEKNRTWSLISTKFKGYKLMISTQQKIEETISRLIVATENHYLLDDMYVLLPQVIKDALSLEEAKLLDVAIKKQNRKFDIWVDQNNYKRLYFMWLVSILIPEDDHIKEDIDISENEEDYFKNIFKNIDKPYSESKEKLIISCLRKHSIALKSNIHSKHIKNVIQRMIEDNNLKNEYDVKALSHDLLPHLSLTLSKHEQSIQEDINPLAEQLLKKYPGEKKKAVEMLEIFSQEFEMPYTQNDVSYVVMYLYKNRKNNDYKKLRVAVVCATGRGFSNLMEARLANRFKNLKIVKSVSAFHHETFDNNEIDLIVSTIPIEVENIPVVIVSPILGNDDLEKIQRFSDKNESSHYDLSQNEANYLPILKQVNNIGDYASQLSSITVYLLDSLTEYIDEYEISQEKMFGLVIHMLMAVQRWFTEQHEQFEDASLVYQKIANEHPQLYSTMEQFFAKVEQLLDCRINISERISVFHYLD